jgi:uncharacterized protein YwgA
MTDITKEQLERLLASRVLSPEQEKELNEVLKLTADGTNIRVENGYQFLRELRKEVSRQKTMQAGEQLELHTKDISQVPAEIHSTREELALAETFEIIEED